MLAKRAVALSLIALLLLAALSGPLAAGDQSQKESEKKFVGSRNSNKFHNPSCAWAKRIKPENRVYFASVEEAEKAGYVPCKICKPK